MPRTAAASEAARAMDGDDLEMGDARLLSNRGRNEFYRATRIGETIEPAAGRTVPYSTAGVALKASSAGVIR